MSAASKKKPPASPYDLRRPRPKIVVSRCLGFADCRYDGQMIQNDLIAKLHGHAEFITVCPEVAIGLPVPRPPLVLIGSEEKVKLFQPDTGLDLTSKMEDFVKGFLGSLAGQEIKAFILKSRSPSCGLGDVNVYSQDGKSLTLVSQNGTGFLARAVAEKFSAVPLRSELYFLDKANRQDFLRFLFAENR